MDASVYSKYMNKYCWNTEDRAKNSEKGKPGGNHRDKENGLGSLKMPKSLFLEKEEDIDYAMYE